MRCLKSIALAGLLWMAATNQCWSQENRLTIDRIFGGGEFQAAGFSVNWMPEGRQYFVLEPSAGADAGRDIVLVDPQTGQRDVLVTAQQLTPGDAEQPIDISSFQVSPDGNRILIFNNTRRVWR